MTVIIFSLNKMLLAQFKILYHKESNSEDKNPVSSIIPLLQIEDSEYLL